MGSDYDPVPIYECKDTENRPYKHLWLRQTKSDGDFLINFKVLHIFKGTLNSKYKLALKCYKYPNIIFQFNSFAQVPFVKRNIMFLFKLEFKFIFDFIIHPIKLQKLLAVFW